MNRNGVYTKISYLPDGSISSSAVRINLGIDNNPTILFCKTTEDVGLVNSCSHIEEELIIGVKNDKQRLRIVLDEVDFVLFLNTGDQESYSINENGDLIYTKEVGT